MAASIAGQDPPRAPGTRIHYLDNLKAFLVILVILHHAAIAYSTAGGFWQYQTSLPECAPWLTRFLTVNAAFFMGLFFMISGYFVPGSCDRKGRRAFNRDRLIRYGLPLLFAILIMQPLEMYFYYQHYSGAPPLGFFPYLARIYFGFGGRPPWLAASVMWPQRSYGHLWFVENLLVFSLIYAFGKGLFKPRANAGGKAPGLVFLLAVSLLIAMVSAVVRRWYPIDTWLAVLGFLQSEAAHLPQYLVLFSLGIFAYRHAWFARIGRGTGYTALAIGALMSIAVYASALLPPALSEAIFSHWAFYESFLAVFLCWGLIVACREQLDFTSPFLKFLTDNAYAAYIFHFPILLAVQYGLDKVRFCGGLGKFLLVGAITTVLTYGFCAVLRKIPLASRVL